MDCEKTSEDGGSCDKQSVETGYTLSLVKRLEYKDAIKRKKYGV